MTEHITEDIGTVISTHEGPSPTSLDFVVTKGVVHRGQFVEMDYSEGILVALITNVIKTNRYFERSESVKEFESAGKKLFEQFPTHEWEYLQAQTRPLGVFSENGLKRSTFPPSPGTKVRVASPTVLKKFLGFKDEDGLTLGKVEYHDLEVSLPLSKLFQKHLAVLAQSGSGKSVFTKTLIEETLNRTKTQGRIALIVFDVHGEYTSFGEPITDSSFVDYSSKTKIINARDIKIGVPKLSVSTIASITGLSSAQKRELQKIFSKLRQEMKDGLGPFDFYKVKSEIMNDKEIKENTSKALIGWINQLEELDLFDKMDSPAIDDIVEQGKLTVINLSDLIDLRKKQIIVAYFSQKMFNERRAKRLPPFSIILEEAHQFIPQESSMENAISRGIMRTIAREGRKFGASLCVISQRPIQLDTTTLSQCNTSVILRITNPYDLKHIGESCEGLDSRSLDMITSLRVGEALMIGEAVNYPLFFRVYKNKSADSKHEMSLEEAAKRFEEHREKQIDEAKEYL